MLTLHIGPPKTATSSLQEFIQNGKPAQVLYFGIQQPRIDFASIINNPLRHCAEAAYLKCSYPNLDISTVDLISTFQGQLTEGRRGWVSEEMFLTDHPEGVRWQTKIMRLGHLLKELSPTPLITLRHPLHATQSLYRELFFNLPRLYQTFPCLFQFSNAAKVYDYLCVLRILRRAGFKKVRIIDFDSLCAGQVSEMELFDVASKRLVLIPHRNQASTDKVILEKSQRLARSPCSWGLGPRVQYYRFLQSLVAQQSENEICLTNILEHN